MLFGIGKGRMEEFFQKIAGAKQELASQIEETKQWVGCRMDEDAEADREHSTEMKQQIEDLGKRMDELQKMQKRQLQSVEDFLEEEQEQAAVGRALREKAQAAEEGEAGLLSLVCCYQEQMSLLGRRITEESMEDSGRAAAWKRQLEILDGRLKREMRPCAVEETGQVGEQVDFQCHEVLNVVETEDDSLDSKIAEVFCPGCIYRGALIKKARVAVFRRTKDGSDNRN